MAESGASLSGIGIAWRPGIAGMLTDLPDLGFCEVIAESLDPAAPPRAVTVLRERGVPVVPHGVRLCLGGSDPVDPARVGHLAACAVAVGAPLVSEHVAFVRAGGREAGHLLPVPRTREALDVLVANVARTMAELDVPLALEPIAALFDWPEDEYSEADFLAELLERTGALLLLDVANVYANAVNRQVDPVAALAALPLQRVGYVHVAGGAVIDGYYHDTHLHDVPAPVLDLLATVRERSPGPLPVMLERDGRYPSAARLRAELAAVAGASRAAGPRVPRAAVARGRGRVRAHPGRHHPSACRRGRVDDRLDVRQAGLVAALVVGGPAPAGLDVARLRATRRALLRKRVGEAATVWPLLAASLGPRWSGVFAEFVDGRPPSGALREGWDLARAQRERGLLRGGAVAELADREAAMCYDGTGPPRPRRRVGRWLRRLYRSSRRSPWRR